MQFEYATRVIMENHVKRQIKLFSQFKPRSPFAQHLEAFLDNKTSVVVEETLPHDDDVLGMAPEIKPRPKYWFWIFRVY